jgi:hypothetical protein
MTAGKYLKVNEPNVVHETIDGETILLDLKTGNYFSLDGAGAHIWDFIALKGDWKKAVDLLVENNVKQKEVISAEVERFVAELIKEGLLVQTDEFSAREDENAKEVENNLKKTATDFRSPVVNKYSDMQDLLLLDPIHDVDEKGWPESNEIKDEGEAEK